MYKNVIKPLLDRVVALCTLLLLLPFLLMLAVVIRVTMGSPVIFRQERPGRHGRPFVMWKFRSMTDARDESGNLLPDKDRMTWLGNFLRKTSLDELPELFNVLKGDMSLVGPRPLLMRYLPYYTETERSRHDVRPGITGLAQVNGRNTLGWDARLAMDVDYVQRCSFWLDVRIVCKTVGKVVAKKDVVAVDDNPLQDLDVERKNNG